MLNIAVTGGIGAGKSTLTDYLQELGYTVIDADKMSREITSAGGKAMPYIREHFGPDFINEDGSLNRAAMRSLVFQNPKYKEILEKGTTQVILEDIEKIKQEKSAAGEKAVFYDIPLLFEMHQEDNYDRVWVVTADRDLRKERIMARDNIPADIIDLMIESQSEEDVRIQKADVVFNNDGNKEDLYAQIDNALSEI